MQAIFAIIQGGLGSPTSPTGLGKVAFFAQGRPQQLEVYPFWQVRGWDNSEHWRQFDEFGFLPAILPDGILRAGRGR